MALKITILSIYVGLLLLIGYLASMRIKNISDYYVGGKKIGFWAVAFSARATGESGWLLIGLTGMGALAGLSAYWVVIGECLGVFISWFFMAKKFKALSDKYQSITIPDYLESHFKTSKHTLRIIAALVLSIFVTIYVSSQIDATGIAFNSMLNIDYKTGAIVGFLIVLLYIFVGGFVAVVWSDLLQGLLMFFGLITLPLVAYFYLPENTSIVESLGNIDPKLTSLWGTSNNLLMNICTLLGFALIGVGFLGSPQVYVRFMSIKNEAEINKGKWVAIAFTLLTDAAAVSIGILARIFFTESGQDPELILGVGGKEVLNLMVDNFMPAVLVAIYIAIVLSAIMSTIDSLLIMASSAVTRDFYQKIYKPEASEKSLNRLSRAVTLIMAFIGLIIALIMNYVSPDRQIFWVIIFGWSGIAATFCPVIILSLFWDKFSEQGAIASMITGFLCVPLFKFVVQPMKGIGEYFEKLDVLGPAFLISMIVGIAFSYLYPKKEAL